MKLTVSYSELVEFCNRSGWIIELGYQKHEGLRPAWWLRVSRRINVPGAGAVPESLIAGARGQIDEILTKITRGVAVQVKTHGWA